MSHKNRVTEGQPHHSLWERMRAHKLAYQMIFPAVVGMTIVHFIPMLWGVFISFRNYNKFTIRKSPWDVKFVGLKHYIRAITEMDKGFMQSLQVTLSFVIIGLVLSVMLGMAAALIANQRFKGNTLFRGFLLVPYILPTVVSLTCLRFMFLHDGIINKILVEWLGVLKEPVFWLVGKNSFWTIVLGSLWGRWTLFYMVFLAALQAIPQDLYEAAKIDGANAWQRFTHIMLPYLRNVGIIVILLSVVWAFNNYMIPFVMLGGGSSSVPQAAKLLSVEILRESFTNLNFGFGAAQAVLMALLSIVFAALYLNRAKLQSTGDDEPHRRVLPVWRRYLMWFSSGILGVFAALLLGEHLISLGLILAGIACFLILIRKGIEFAERTTCRILFSSGLLFFLVLILFPLYWLLSSSLKVESEIRKTTLFPTVFAWRNYIQVWKDVPLAHYFGNSILISVCSMLLAVMIATIAGYAISRFNFPGRKLLNFSTLATQMFPGVLFLLPYFLIFSALQRTRVFTVMLGGFKFMGDGIYWGNVLLLILTYTAFILPFALWVIRGFMDSIPREVEDAGLIDGCTQFQAFLRLVLPLALPGIATVAILAFMQGWNEVLFSSVLTNPHTRTLALGLQDYRVQMAVTWNLTMAAGVIISIPVVIFFAFLQRHMVSGLTAGAMKG